MLFIVDRLVYCAVLLLFVIAITQLMRFDEHMLEALQLHLTTYIFCVAFRFFFQLRLGSQSTYNMYEDGCLLLYLTMSIYEYWCCWCCCTYRVVP